MKLPRKVTGAYAIQGFIQVIFLVIALLTHDWFYLGVAYLINPPYQRIINYEGMEDDL